MDGPVWEKVEPVQPVNKSLKKTLADIESHLEAGHHFRDSNRMTWAHETTHGINAKLRNQRFMKLRSPVNAFYCLDGKCVYIPEPKITITRFAPLIPRLIRGLSYNLYLRQQTRYWDDRPLYILDEWVAYTNGAIAGKEYNLPEWEYELHRAHNFSIYAIYLLKTVEENDTTYNCGPLRNFIRWNIERVFSYTPETPPKHIQEYLDNIKSSPETEGLRVYAKKAFGPAWCLKFYRF